MNEMTGGRKGGWLGVTAPSPCTAVPGHLYCKCRVPALPRRGGQAQRTREWLDSAFCEQ